MEPTTTNEKGQIASNDLTPGHHLTNTLDSAATAGGAQAHGVSQYGTCTDLQRKDLARLQARFALKGYSLDALADGGLLLYRWGLTRRIATLPEAEMWLLHIGGAQ